MVVGVVAVFGREGLGLQARVDIAKEEVEGGEGNIFTEALG